MSDSFAADDQLSPEDQAAADAIDERIGGENAPEDEKPAFTPTPEYDPQAEIDAKKGEAAEEAEASKPDPAEDDSEAMAKRMGWAPKEKWRGPDHQWVDAKTFIERANPAMLMERINKMERDHNQTVSNLERMNQVALDKQKADLSAQRDALIEEYAGNPAAIRQINKNHDEAVGKLAAQSEAPPQPPEATRSWVQQHPQFNTDPVFQASAKAISQQLFGELGESADAAHFAELDRRLQTRFPEYYDQEKPAPQNGAPPAGARSMDGVKVGGGKRSNYASRLPAAAREQGKRFVKQGLFKDLEEYAKDYNA
ncbi:MAG: hypothetical protein AAGF20_00115 [Pseudomonadota bacterium]